MLRIAVPSKTTATHKRPDFQAFMAEVVADIPRGQAIHVILDNYRTHKKNLDGLAEHPNLHFHYMPTSANWLNQVEIWFGILSGPRPAARKTLSGASFESTAQLTQAIEAFIATHNQNAASFVWRKRDV